MPNSSDFYSLIKIPTTQKKKKKIQNHSKVLTIFQINSSLSACHLRYLSLTASHKNLVMAKLNSLVLLLVPYAKTIEVVNTKRQIILRANSGLFWIYLLKARCELTDKQKKKKEACTLKALKLNKNIAWTITSNYSASWTWP